MANCKNTLLIRHLPECLTKEDKEDLLKHFGAITVRCMDVNGRLKHSAFATFHSKEDAEEVLKYLHQREILGSKLVVEFTKKQYDKFLPSVLKIESKITDDEETKTKDSLEDKSRIKMKEFYTKLNAIAPAFGLEYAPSPNLYYLYPPPNVQILTNIAHCLATVPKFYVQVLHLMNKMNLPAPFGPITPAPPMAEGPTEPQIMKNEMEISSHSEEESEFESDEEVDKMGNINDYRQVNETDPIKRPLKTKVRKKLKRPKLQQLIVQLKPSNPQIPPQNPSEIFDIPEGLSQRKIEFKIASTLETPEAITNENVIEGEGFGTFNPSDVADMELKNIDGGSDLLSFKEFISSRELRKNKLSSSERKSISAFKNYEIGELSSRLYIKNLARHVLEKDLIYIYGRYVDHNSELEQNMFNVQLLTGRMKGQAFITLPSKEKAQKALEETLGYILYDKPMVVLFARSARPKETERGKK